MGSGGGALPSPPYHIKGGPLKALLLPLDLAGALRASRHLRGDRVLSRGDGRPLTQKIVQGLVRKAAKKAYLANGGVHILRHTFCSHLAMSGAPVRAIRSRWAQGHHDNATLYALEPCGSRWRDSFAQ